MPKALSHTVVFTDDIDEAVRLCTEVAGLSSVAPYEVAVIPLGTGDELPAAEDIATQLAAADVETVIDDRDERAGVKFKDADLVGIPFRINVGKKAAEGKVELVTRATSSSVDVAIGDLVALLKERVEEEILLGKSAGI